MCGLFGQVNVLIDSEDDPRDDKNNIIQLYKIRAALGARYALIKCNSTTVHVFMHMYTNIPNEPSLLLVSWWFSFSQNNAKIN